MPYQMPSGKWRGKRMIHGQVRTKVFPTKQEAKKWEAEQDEKLWRTDPFTIPTTCLIDLANAYLGMSRERHDAKTIAEKDRAFKYLFKAVDPRLDVADMTPAIALTALQKVCRDKSGNVANVARKNLAAAWRWGRRYLGIPALNPFLEVDRFPFDKKPRYVPSEADFWKAYEAASLQDKIYLLLLLHTAARRSESFRLTWADVDFQNRQIRYGTRKNRQSSLEYAWVPMTKELHEKLQAHKKTAKSVYVFTNPVTGQPYTSRQHYMRRLCERAEVAPFGFHAIRHLSATLQAHGGMDVPEVQSILRHKSPNTTSRYIRSLGVQPGKLDGVFRKKRGAKVIPFTPLQKAIGT